MIKCGKLEHWKNTVRIPEYQIRESIQDLYGKLESWNETVRIPDFVSSRYGN
jgi:hypothetical protein